MSNVKIIAFVGMPGAGKTEAVRYVTNLGYPKVYFGGVVYDEMDRRGIEITPQSQQQFREEWRKEQGNDVIVNEIIRQIHRLVESGQHRIVADGIYSWSEYKAMKHEFPGELIVAAIVAPRHIRHHRLATRPERPFTGEESTARDWTEIENIEKGGPIAVADYYIHNDSDIDKLHQQIDNVLSSTDFTN